MELAAMSLKGPDRHRLCGAMDGARESPVLGGLEIDGFDCALRLLQVDGEEWISQLFRFEVVVVGELSGAAWQDMAGRRASLTFPAGDTTRYVHGMIERFEQRDDGKKWTAFRAVLVPEVWRLSQGSDYRIFQGLSVPAILSAVLRKAGLAESAYRLSLAGRYVDREYCVQYRESDWTFLSRLMEEEGIHYFFEHTENGHILVIGDSASVHEPIEGDRALPFRPSPGALLAGEHVSRFHYAERLCPGKVTLRDHNFKKASLCLQSSAHAGTVLPLEVYEYPGRYDSPDLGTHFAQVQLDAVQAARKTAGGEGTCLRFVPGSRFRLVDHPRDDLNQEYLIMQVTHHWHASAPETSGEDGGLAYRNEFCVIPTNNVFRPPRRTPRPAIHGVQTATVVGPPGESIYTDEYGRVKVQFHWDREGRHDEHSSCWVRVSQPWAGPGWGALFLPRIGHQVVVSFIDGDPDRPMIVASIYDSSNVPPELLPAQKTRTTLKSASVQGDGFNELRFEDKTGAEEIYLQAQRDLNELVKNDHTTTVKADQHNDVSGNQREHIGGEQSLEVDGNRTIHIHGSHRIAIDGTKPSQGIRGSSMTVTGKHTLDASESITHQAPEFIKLECGGSSVLIEPGKITLSAGGGAQVVLDANALVQSAAGSHVLLDANGLMRSSGGAQVLLDADALTQSSAGSVVLLDANALMASTGGSQVLLDANATMATGAEAVVQGTNAAVVGAADATLAGGGGAVKADGSGVTASGPKVDVAGGLVNITGGVVKIN